MSSEKVFGLFSLTYNSGMKKQHGQVQGPNICAGFTLLMGKIVEPTAPILRKWVGKSVADALPDWKRLGWIAINTTEKVDK